MFDKDYLEKVRTETEKWEKNQEIAKERTDLPFRTDSSKSKGMKIQ